MRYVLLGSLGPAWATRHDERVAKAKAKLDTLGIRLEAVYYTQGEVDFVDVVEAPSAEAMLAFSVWYVERAGPGLPFRWRHRRRGDAQGAGDDLTPGLR